MHTLEPCITQLDQHHVSTARTALTPEAFVVQGWSSYRYHAVRVDQIAFAMTTRGDRMFSLISLAFQSRILKLKNEFTDDRVIIRLSSRGSIEDVEFYSDEIRVLIDNDDLSLWKTPTLCTKAFARLDAAYEFQLSLCDSSADRLSWARNQGDNTRLLWRYFVKLVRRSKHSHNNAVDKVKTAFKARHGSIYDDSDSDDPLSPAAPVKKLAKAKLTDAKDDEEDAPEDAQAEDDEEDAPEDAEDDEEDAPESESLMDSEDCEPPQKLQKLQHNDLDDVMPLIQISDTEPEEEDVEARCHLTPGPSQAAAIIAQALKVSEQGTASTHGHHKTGLGLCKKRRLFGKQPTQPTTPQRSPQQPSSWLSKPSSRKAKAPAAHDGKAVVDGAAVVHGKAVVDGAAVVDGLSSGRWTQQNRLSANSMMAKQWSMELAQQTASLAASPPLSVALGIEKLGLLEYHNHPEVIKLLKENILNAVDFPPEQPFVGLAVKVKYLYQRKKVIWQIKDGQNKAICQLQTKDHPEPEDVMSMFLRAKIISWFATAGVDRRVIKQVRALVDEKGLFGD